MPNTPTTKEIRQAFSDYSQATQHVRDEGRIDMRFVAGDPWEPEDRLAREDAHRPCMAFDELNQYLNQAANQVRQNKRAAQVTPEGDGANDKDAEHRANIMRGIDYRSNAQQTHITAFDNMVMRSAGYGRITIQKMPGKTLDTEIRIKPVENPDTIIFNPSYRMPDGSDVEEVFEIDFLSKEKFKRRFPKAKAQSFTGEDMMEARNWIREDDLQIAGYWKVHLSFENLLLLEQPEGDVVVYESELKEMLSGRDKTGKFAKIRDLVKVKREMREEKRTVVQYVTNGIEILDEVPWIGTRIPICGCFGKQLFMDDGSGPKRHLLSMVRLARDPAMFMAYAISQEAEEMGMAPKSPFIGYKGQFESDAEAFEMVNKIPRGYLQVDPVVDGASGQILPLPVRPQFTPNIGSYEEAKESGRRSLQSAMGLTPLPTAAQRQNEKSGIAMERIETMQSIGTFHFVDNYDRYLNNMYWQVNELIGPIYDTARDVPIVRPDGTYSVLRVNDHDFKAQNPEKDVLHTDKGQFGVTISVGPNYQSEREEQSEFVDSLLEKLPALGLPAPLIQKILAIAIRMKATLGPLGKEIADIFSPPEGQELPPEAQAIVANLQAQMQQLQQENSALHMERAGKVLELTSKQQIEGAKISNDSEMRKLTEATKIIVAMITASKDTDRIYAQKELAKLGFAHDQANADRDMTLELHKSAHERGMAAEGHNQAKDLAAQSALAAQQNQDQQQP
jgi:hypothetical protein